MSKSIVTKIYNQYLNGISRCKTFENANRVKKKKSKLVTAKFIKMNNKELLKKIEVLQAENEQLKTEIEQYKITSKTVEETLDRDVVNFSNPHGKINSENLANPPANTINKLHETVGNQAPPDVTGKNQIPGIELLQSEAKYKNLVENSLDGIIIVRDNKILFANDTFCKLTESACEKILNEPALNFIHPNDREKMVLIAEKRKNGDRSTMNETIRLMGKNGEYIDCDSFFSIIEFEGKPASFITLHNITETKRMQLALIESEKKYRDLSEMLPQSIYELDLKGNITYLNQTGLDTFGITRADYGISAFTFIVPSDHEKMKANMQRSILENHSSHGNKYTAVRKNGETFPVMIFAGPITENAKVVGTRGIILDMTEHEAMEKALRESEEKYRTLIDKALDGIIITQLGYFKFVNPAFCEMMLYSAEELINKPYLEFVDKEDHDMLINFHKRRMAGEEFHVMSRSRLIRKDGKTLQVELNIRTTEMDGQPSAFIIIRNITDRLQTEEELRIAKQKLEMLNQNLEIRIRESSLKLTEANTQLIRLQKENLQSQF